LLAAELRRDIRKGQSGGQTFAKLSSLARRYGLRFIARKPFTKLWSTRQATGASKGIIPIRYNPVMGSDGLKVNVGLVDTRQEKLSKSWVNSANHAEAAQISGNYRRRDTQRIQTSQAYVPKKRDDNIKNAGTSDYRPVLF